MNDKLKNEIDDLQSMLSATEGSASASIKPKVRTQEVPNVLYWGKEQGLPGVGIKMIRVEVDASESNEVIQHKGLFSKILGALKGKEDIKKPRRTFFISAYPITQSVYKAIMGYQPSYYTADPDTFDEWEIAWERSDHRYSKWLRNTDDWPVERVSYLDAKEFICKLNDKLGKRFRLPTFEEWVYAAKGGESETPGAIYGNDTEPYDVAWFHQNSDYTYTFRRPYPDDEYNVQSINGIHAWDTVNAKAPRTVGKKSPNSLGLYDMNGNVFEWTSTDAEDNQHKKACGGSFASEAIAVTNTSWRSQEIKLRSSVSGFRIVLDI